MPHGLILSLLCAFAQGPTAAAPPDSDPVTVVCKATGRNQISWLRPAGERVAKGERLCRLDDSTVRARIVATGLDLQRARVEVRKAILEREAAELAAAEQRVLDAMERDLAREELRLARTAKEVVRLRLEEARAARPVVASTVRKAEVAWNEAVAQVAMVEQKLRALEAPGLTPALRAALAMVERATGHEKAASARVDESLAIATELEAQVDAHEIVAPVAGTLVYVRERPPGDERGYALIEVGAYVHEGQPLFRLLPDPMPDRR